MINEVNALTNAVPQPRKEPSRFVLKCDRVMQVANSKKHFDRKRGQDVGYGVKGVSVESGWVG